MISKFVIAILIVGGICTLGCTQEKKGVTNTGKTLDPNVTYSAGAATAGSVDAGSNAATAAPAPVEAPPPVPIVD